MKRSMPSAELECLNAKPTPVTDKAVRLLANSIFRQLQDEGCLPRDIISVSSQLIGLVTHELQKDETGAF